MNGEENSHFVNSVLACGLLAVHTPSRCGFAKSDREGAKQTQSSFILAIQILVVGAGHLEDRTLSAGQRGRSRSALFAVLDADRLHACRREVPNLIPPSWLATHRPPRVAAGLMACRSVSALLCLPQSWLHCFGIVGLRVSWASVAFSRSRFRGHVSRCSPARCLTSCMCPALVAGSAARFICYSSVASQNRSNFTRSRFSSW